jgi:hypothetical protein
VPFEFIAFVCIRSHSYTVNAYKRAFLCCHPARLALANCRSRPASVAISEREGDESVSKKKATSLMLVLSYHEVVLLQCASARTWRHVIIVGGRLVGCI